MAREDVSKPNIKGQRLMALFLLGNVLFNYPLLSLFKSLSDFLWERGYEKIAKATHHDRYNEQDQQDQKQSPQAVSR
jgi:hypothetical protein